METGKTPSDGACDHTQPSDVARMGQEFLQAQGIPEPVWEGCRFGYGGDGGSGPFKSVYMEVEYRKGNWVAVKLDRLKEELGPDIIGFKCVLLTELASQSKTN
jgi:hypothetical protein